MAELLSDVSETQFHNTVILVSSKERFWFSAIEILPYSHMITEQAQRVYAEYFIVCFMILLHESKHWRIYANLCEKYFERN